MVIETYFTFYLLAKTHALPYNCNQTEVDKQLLGIDLAICCILSYA